MVMSFEKVDGWTFNTLKGCPIELIGVMAQLGRMAELYHRAEKMGWTVFDEWNVVPELAKIRSMLEGDPSNIYYDDGHDEGQHHTNEAFRYAIMLYTYRVFDRQRDEQTPSTIAKLADLTMEHVLLIGQNRPIQKQVLLPVFLAGAEMKTPESRSTIEDYCRYWSRKSHFGHFDSALEVLQDLWRVADADPTIWWGAHLESYPWAKVTQGYEDMVQELFLG